MSARQIETGNPDHPFATTLEFDDYQEGASCPAQEYDLEHTLSRLIMIFEFT